jgi:hypothetical protein
MGEDILERSKSADIRNSMAAMKRAAKRARVIGKATATGIVVQRDGCLVQLPAEDIEIDLPNSPPVDLTFLESGR